MRSLLATFWIGVFVLVATRPAPAVEIERAPIRYSQSQPANAVSRLEQKLESGAARLKYDADHGGYLRALLTALDVPVSSQTLVFSKTSMQRDRIAPRTPRAIYFNEDVYLGYCQDGDVMEISVADPKLGAAFYTLAQQPQPRPQILRQTDNCLLCHASSHTDGLPGHLLRSLYVDHGGFPVLSLGSTHVDQTTPWDKRWGGWYVTGTHGAQMHQGNLVISPRAHEDEIDRTPGQNVCNLAGRFDLAAYPSPHSDLVALMVLGHQTVMHNLITRANLLTRAALHDEAELNRELKEPAGHRWDSTNSRIRDAGEPLVRYLLCREEAPLAEPVRGTSTFAADFAKRGPFDRRGRSLRQLDLQTRLFKYPCSYLIYTASFDALPAEVRDYVWRRVFEVLSGQDESREFAHLSADDRQAILEIVADTKSNLPKDWRAAVSATSSR